MACFAALSLTWSLCERALHAQARSWSSAIAAIGPERSSWRRQRSASCCNGISSGGRLGLLPPHASRAAAARLFFCENRAGPTCVGAGLRRGVRAAGSYRCGWRFESSRAHHAVFLTARFLRDCQQASNWRAFAAAFGSQRRPFLASMRILGVVSLGRGISFPRCRSILDKTCACSCARRCFYVTPRCPRRPSANSIVYPSGS